MGSITAVTDANGNIIERVYYDIYGKPTFKDASGNVITKSSIGNNILFQGREYDHELNLYYFRARYYDPIMGRFLSTDPMEYTDSMNLYQAFNMNPYNFFDPFGLVIHEWENLGVYGPASWRPDRPVPYKLFTYDESGAYARFKDSIKIEPVQKSDGKWTIRASFKMTVLIWLTNKSKLEHEKAHIVQYMDLYMRILRKLEYIEETADYKPYETKEAAQAVIDLVAGPDYSNIKDMKINIYPVPSVHDKKTRKRANEIIDETNYFEMEKTTDPPFKVRKFEIVKTWLDIILGIKDEK
jgi:RHS repeat-associated protein